MEEELVGKVKKETHPHCLLSFNICRGAKSLVTVQNQNQSQIDHFGEGKMKMNAELVVKIEPPITWTAWTDGLSWLP